MIFSKQKDGSPMQFDELYKLDIPSAKKENYYPQTKVKMEPGDILYSAKGWSTFLVGHVGMVGKDYKIYHSHPQGGFADRLPNYLSRHKFGTTLTVLRPQSNGREAAEWAANNVGLVKRYFFDPRIGGMKWNYCTKFIWQAFWHSGSGDITNRNLNIKSIGWIYPFRIKKTTFFEEKAVILLGSKS